MYKVTRNRNGKIIEYWHDIVRVPGRKTPKTIYRGAVNPKRRRSIVSTIAENVAPPPHGFSVEERLLEQNAETMERDKQAQAVAIAELHDQFGLTMPAANPAPTEATPAPADAAPAASENAPGEAEAPSDDGA